MQALPLWQKAAAGLTAGGLGALVGSPADLTLIRMQADSTLPMASRRNYKNVGDAMVSPCPAILCFHIELQWTRLWKACVGAASEPVQCPDLDSDSTGPG